MIEEKGVREEERNKEIHSKEIEGEERRKGYV